MQPNIFINIIPCIMKWSRFNILAETASHEYFLFNTRTLALSRLDKSTYDNLLTAKDDFEVFLGNASERELSELKARKVIVDDTDDEDLTKILQYKKSLQSYGSKSLGVVVCPTLSCNFACPYCYEHELPQTLMKGETQDRLIEFINRNSEGKKGLVLNWHGGEPLLAFEAIKQIYDKIEKRSLLKITHSSMVSNGYLLDEEKCRYLAERKLDYLQITIDGNKEVHDKLRKTKNGQSSYSRIIENIDMATELMPDCTIGIRTNINRDNKDGYPNLYKELSSRWKGKNCVIYHSFVLGDSYRCGEKKSQIELSAEEKNEFDARLAEEGIIDAKSLYPKFDHGVFTCMDDNAYVVAPDGKLYKCWADVGISSRSIGDLSSGVRNLQIVSQFMTASDKFSDSKCLKCGLLPICSGGCNLCRIKDEHVCHSTRLCDYTKHGIARIIETYSHSL